MYRGLSTLFKVVQSDDDEYAVWHAEAVVRREWSETGRIGSVIECLDYIEAEEGSLGYLFNIDDSR